MSLLFSWIGTADFAAWKANRQGGDGPLLAVARQVRATEVEVLWDDGSTKVPLAESDHYADWLTQQLRELHPSATVRVRACLNAKVVDFAWVYQQLERLHDEHKLADRQAHVNASSGTWVMSACWIVFKKSNGLDLRLFRSSPERGVEPIDLPPNLTIEMTEVLKGRRSPLFDRYVRGELHLARGDVEGIISASEGMNDILLELTVVAPFNDVPILLLGEPGVGKSVLAAYVHKRSGAHGDLCTIDCGMLRDERSFGDLWGWKAGAFTGAGADNQGRIKNAASGTLFLDEVGNADAFTQQNLLRLIQEKKYRPLGANDEKEIDLRVIAATNKNLRAEVREGRFRQDLLDRLSVFELTVPSLRERRDDIVPLARDFVRVFNSTWEAEIKKLGGRPKKLSSAAERELRRHDWPGNVRELQNLVTRLIVRTISSEPEITSEDVRREFSNAPQAIQGLPPLGDGFCLDEVLNDVRLRYLKEAWTKASGNKSKVRELLGLRSRTPVRTLIKNLANSGYPVEEFQ
jgi:DNA-binding NtrC family response regulator